MLTDSSGFKISRKISLPTRNRLLEAMAPSDFDVVRNLLEPTWLKKLMVLEEPNKPSEYVYFPEGSVISSLAQTARDGSVEIVMLGRSDLVGISVPLGGGTATQHSRVQIAGTALRIRSHDLLSAMATRPSIRDHLTKYLRSLIVQLYWTSFCNSKHDTLNKLMRWLLLAHDHSGSDILPVTQSLLSIALNVTRPGITKALSRLESERAIARSRGQLRIRDRLQLVSRCCSCYTAICESSSWLDAVEIE
jgi:CRP-like cAMP-binding protein